MSETKKFREVSNMGMKRILSVLLLLMLAAPVWGQDFEKGLEAYEAYERGDYAAALSEWRPLADQGIASAQFNLGLMYYDGQGVPQDYVQAHMWFNLAASRPPPGKVRDVAVKYRDILAAKMTPAQIAEAQRLAREWMAAFEKRVKKDFD